MARPKASRFNTPDNPFARQTNLLHLGGFKPYSRLPWPEASLTLEGSRDVLREAIAEGNCGVDFEFSTATLGSNNRKYNPTIIGVASRHSSAAIRFDKQFAAEVMDAALQGRIKLIAHAGITADKPVIDQALGIDSPLDIWVDSLIEFYCDHHDFTQAPNKEGDEDGGGSQGLMNLYTASNYYNGTPNWKYCRGNWCIGPCPSCRVFDYCATDSWAGIGISLAASASIHNKGIPRSLVEHVSKVNDYCYRMEVRGVNIDHANLKKVSKKLDKKRQDIFPFEKIGKKKVYTGPFNPNSVPQVIEYFEKNGITLNSKDKNEVYKELRKQLKDLGHAVSKPEELEKISDGELSEVISNLKKLYLYQTAGKGVKSWFSDEYFDPSGVIHPRFIPTGTCTGRLSSSGPNFQNIPSKRTFGAEIRKLIIPFNPDNMMVKADYSSLELAICLWYAGGEAPSPNFFMELVASKPEIFDAAVIVNPQMSKRDIAKSVVHASNYAEGFTTMTAEDLRRRENEIRKGALVAYDGRNNPLWTFRNRIVCFTGANLAERLFGSATHENRALANQLRLAYLAFVPKILAWQESVGKEIEDSGYCQSASGRRLDLYGTDFEDYKVALAFLGQGGGGDYCQEMMLNNPDIPILQVHDELVYEIPRGDEASVTEYFRFMVQESKRLPGFKCAIKYGYGDNWGSIKEIGSLSL